MPKHLMLNSEYDPFARIYNRYWGVAYRAEAFPIVKRLLLSRLKPGASLLDVCCGTGQFTEQIRQQGFDMAGIDASGEMIAYARKNAPEVSLTVADARAFALGRKFAGAYSVFESLNHIPDLAGPAAGVPVHPEAPEAGGSVPVRSEPGGSVHAVLEHY